MNDENLKPLNTRSKSEQRKIQSMGGKANGEKRRQAITCQAAAKMILGLLPNLPDSAKEALVKMGLDRAATPDIMTISLLAIAQKAIKGDSNAFATLRDTAGERPTEKHEIAQSFAEMPDIKIKYHGEPGESDASEND